MPENPKEQAAPILSVSDVLPFLEEYLSILDSYAKALRQHLSIQTKHNAINATGGEGTYAYSLLFVALSNTTDALFSAAGRHQQMTPLVIEIARLFCTDPGPFEKFKESGQTDPDRLEAIPKAQGLAIELRSRLQSMGSESIYDPRDDGPYENDVFVWKKRPIKLNHRQWSLLNVCWLMPDDGLRFSTIIHSAWSDSLEDILDHSVVTMAGKLHNTLNEQGVKLPWKLSCDGDVLRKKPV